MIVDDDGIHVDEGTIHAWLDGELDESQAARIQAHIGQCGACAAHVAEARGLIAGASRVIGMLDEVPKPLVRPASAPNVGTDTSAWRLLRVTPARASIAAMLVVAVGIALTRGQLAREVPASSRDQNAALPMSVAPTSPAAAASAPATDTILESAIARRLAAEQPPRTVERAPGVAIPAPPAATPAPNADLAEASSKIAAGRTTVAAQRVAAAPGADRTRAGVGQQAASEAVTNEVALTAAKAADAAGSSARSVSRTPSSGEIAAGQCYLVESATPAVWGSVHLPMVVAVDSSGRQARVLTPSGEDTEARAYLQYNGTDSALFRLRRIGFDGSMTLLAAAGTRTGTLKSSYIASNLSEIVVTSPPRRAAIASSARAPTAKSTDAGTTNSNAANASTNQASITARGVACPSRP